MSKIRVSIILFCIVLVDLAKFVTNLFLIIVIKNNIKSRYFCYAIMFYQLIVKF